MRSVKIVIPFFLFCLAACDKNTFNTKPSLKLKSVSTRDVIPANPSSSTPPLVLTFEYTDAEGDLAGARVGVQKIEPECALSNFVDTLSYSISQELPASRDQQADLQVIFTYFQIQPQCNFNDSANFRVWITDRAGNVSDTAETGIIIIR